MGEFKLIRQDQDTNQYLAVLEQSLLAAMKGRTFEIPPAEIREHGLVKALRKRAKRF